MILDGWGYSSSAQNNAIAEAHTPQWDEWLAAGKQALLTCSGEAVGLPAGQMGNSEVGHMHIGAGRVLYQDYTRINQAIDTGDFFKNPALVQVMEKAKDQHRSVHVAGLLSPGGVHSHEKHFCAMAEALSQQDIRNVSWHLFLDGRDTPPRSAEPSIKVFEEILKQHACGKIKSISGRYYAMDRDERWDRIEKVYDLLTEGKSAFSAATALEALEEAYARGESDEFIQPVCIGSPSMIADGDTVIMMNFRADRVRQLSRALINPGFSGFERHCFPKIGQFVTLTDYAKDIPAIVLFPQLTPRDTLGECIAKAGLKQLRVAETEKYAHVTFFLNGGIEQVFPGEDRVLIPSPRVATYDLQPEMSAPAVKDCIVKALLEKRCDVIIANFANADMVGHTGDLKAAIQAVEYLDRCFQDIAKAAKEVSAELLITADHGNAECMFDPLTNQQHTAHTAYPVPFLYVGHRAELVRYEGSLIDVAPTLLYLLGLNIPSVMEGRSLVKWVETE